MLPSNLLIGLALTLFFIGFMGTIIRRNLLIMLMCMELMLNAIILALVTLSYQRSDSVGIVLSFLIYIVAASEIAIAIPIILHLVRTKKSLDVENYSDLKG